MSERIVFGNTFVPGFTPVENVLDNMEHVLHLTAYAGYAAFEFLFMFPCQTVAIVALECASLAIDTIIALNAIDDVPFQFNSVLMTGSLSDAGSERL